MRYCGYCLKYWEDSISAMSAGGRKLFLGGTLGCASKACLVAVGDVNDALSDRQETQRL